MKYYLLALVLVLLFNDPVSANTGSHNENPTYRKAVESYLLAWQAKSTSESRELLEKIWTESSIHQNPFNYSKGVEALTNEISAFQQTMPNHQIHITSFNVSKNTVLIGVDLIAPDGSSVLPGFDFIEFDVSGKIIRVVGFF